MPELGIARDQNEDTILHVLARKPLAFSDKIGLGIWQRLVYACKYFLFFKKKKINWTSCRCLGSFAE